MTPTWARPKSMLRREIVGSIPAGQVNGGNPVRRAW
jgi:hypothetical protein